MFKKTLPATERFDDMRNIFVKREETVIELEHSLLSVSKWEEHYKKPFLTEAEKSDEEELYYILCMDTRGDLTFETVRTLSISELREIKAYIEDSHTATTFTNRDRQSRGRNEIMTSEVIYYTMIALEIPFECETWNLNRLFTLIRVCSIKNNPKKMGMKDILKSNHSLNAARRAAMGSRG
jgi:hypothetical protein